MTAASISKEVVVAADVRLRPARADDVKDLVRLAALESVPPLPGPVIVAEVEGEVVAAHCLMTGRSLADPFVPSVHLIELLRQHAVRAQRRSGELDGRIEIELLPAAASDDPSVIERVTELVNLVYAIAESGLWAEGATRTSVREVAELTRAGQIAVARLGHRTVGCVRVQRLDAETGEFGMLAADPAHRNRGIGRELVRFAEEKCRAEGLRAIELELLVPRGWTHPSKEFLDAWYTRIGYRIVRTGTIDEAYPALAPLLATPCDFVIYRKDLE